MNLLDAAAELRWLFRESEGAMGLRSNFSGMLAALEGGGFHPSPSYHLDDRCVRAAESAREFKKALASCPVWARVLCGVAFRDPGADERHALLSATSAAVEEWRRSKSKRALPEWLEKQRTSKERVRREKFVKLQEKAREVLDAALVEYARARGKVKDLTGEEECA